MKKKYNVENTNINIFWKLVKKKGFIIEEISKSVYVLTFEELKLNKYNICPSYVLEVKSDNYLEIRSISFFKKYYLVMLLLFIVEVAIFFIQKTQIEFINEYIFILFPIISVILFVIYYEYVTRSGFLKLDSIVHIIRKYSKRM